MSEVSNDTFIRNSSLVRQIESRNRRFLIQIQKSRYTLRTVRQLLKSGDRVDIVQRFYGCVFFLFTPTWMSQEVSKWLINGL